MIFGITGNTNKDQLWQPVADLVGWLLAHDYDFVLHQNVADGLAERHLADAAVCGSHCGTDLAAEADVILSFGGDGTLLNSAHEIGSRGTPILGVNIGRLGFLADIEVGQVQQAVQRLAQGDYRIEPRVVLAAQTDPPTPDAAPTTPDHSAPRTWALNEFVLLRSGETGMVSIEVVVDGALLNTYWSDGLIIATPTGSTAYNLSVGGSILVPGSGALILTPIAPHTLTARPIVLSDASTIEVRMLSEDQPYVFNADGRTALVLNQSLRLVIRRADHTVNLIKLPEQHFFQNLRSKLMWGVHKAQ